MKYLAVLGRQPELSVAELAAWFSGVERVGDNLAAFELPGDSGAPDGSGDSEKVDIDRFGGVLKFAVEMEAPPRECLLDLPEGKIVMGISDYGANPSKRRAFETAKKLKRELSKRGRSVRILPNRAAAISTAAAIHNRLGRKENRVELLLVGDKVYRSVGSQNIDAYARRDQGRPARDARVGMLPPKLAQILINLCGPLEKNATILDAFCGTGVVLQEALLMGHNAYGSDLSEKMVQYSKRNLEFLGFRGYSEEDFGEGFKTEDGPVFRVEVGDATGAKWVDEEKRIDRNGRISAAVSEIYLGRPFSQVPSERAFREERENCKAILLGFLRNLAGQIETGTPVVLAVPAWLRRDGEYEKLVEGENARTGGERAIRGENANDKNTLDEIRRLGYNVEKSGSGGLVYARPGQIVAREILILRKN